MTNYLITRMNRELSNSKYRALASSVLIIISVSFYIALAGMVPNTEKELEDTVEELKLNDYLVHIHSANESEVQTVGSIQGVKDAEFRLQISSRIQFGSNGKVQQSSASLYGLDPEQEPGINIPRLMGDESTYFQGNGSGTVLLERNFADKEDIKVGDTISVQTEMGSREVTVIALVLSPEFIMLPLNPNSILPYPGEMAVMFVPIQWLRESFDLGVEMINEVVFLFEEDVDDAELQSTINDAELQSTINDAELQRTINDADLQNTIDEALASHVILFSTPKDEVYGYALVKQDLEQGRTFAALFALIMLLVAFFIVYVSFARIVQEQRKEIGILRALGYSRRSVLLSYLYMAFVIGLGGSLAGIVVGVPLSKMMSDFYIGLIIGTEATSFSVDYSSAVIGLFFGPLTAMLASGMAVWDTVSMEPQDAIRGTPKTDRKITKAHLKGKPGYFRNGLRGGDRLTKIRKMLPWSLPYIILFTERTLRRNRMRTSFTSLAVAFSILIGALPILMWSSFENSMEDSIDDYEKWDLIVEYAYPLNDTTASTLQYPGITEHTYISRIQGQLLRGGEDERTLITGIDQNQTLHLFNLVTGRNSRTADEAMVNKQFADEYDLGTGDIITVVVGTGILNLTISGIVRDIIGEIIIDLDLIEQFFGGSLFMGMYARVQNGELDGVQDALGSSPLVSEVETREGSKSGLLDFMSSFSDMIYLFSLIGVVIAAATLANTVFIGVLERFPQYGQLRAIGYTRREISKSIVAELLVLICIGAVIGAPLTYLALLGYEEAFKEFFPLYDTTLTLSNWSGYLFVVVLTILLAFLSALPSIRLLNRMDIAQTVSGARFG